MSDFVTDARQVFVPLANPVKSSSSYEATPTVDIHEGFNGAYILHMSTVNAFLRQTLHGIFKQVFLTL